MARNWTQEEDEFIHSYFDGMGDFIGVHDLDRPKGAATRRAKFLKDSGAWAALDRASEAYADYLRAIGRRVGGDDSLAP